MQPDQYFPEEIFSQDDAAELERVLGQWENPDLDILLGLLDKTAEKPFTSAYLLGYLHEHFTSDEIERSRRLRREKQLGILAWEDEDWSMLFRWEVVNCGCRILAYLGRDQEVLIPEQIGERPVKEIARSFFLSSASVDRLFVPKGVRIGTILPHEAAGLFGTRPVMPEIVWLDRDHPLAFSEEPVFSIPSADDQAGNLVQFGRYAYEPDGSVRPITWLVLRRLEDRALLSARQALELLPYHHNRSAVLWSECDLRSWLNDSFLHTAFTAGEQSLLQSTTLSDGPNPVYHTRNNSYAQDRVFLLGPDEWMAYREDHPVIKTPWAARDDAVGPCPVWMRMPGVNTQYAVVLDKSPDYQGRLVNDKATGICPAVWVRIPGAK